MQRDNVHYNYRKNHCGCYHSPLPCDMDCISKCGYWRKNRFSLPNHVLCSRAAIAESQSAIIIPNVKKLEGIHEKIAEECHNQWSGWMKYLFSKCTTEYDLGKTGRLVIPKEFVERWNRQVNTSYSNLSEEEKDSDRIEADKILKILEHHEGSVNR